MVIVLEKLFVMHLQACPLDFQQKFRKVYQQLKVVDKPTEIKGIMQVEKKLYKLVIDKSRIAIRVDGDKLIIGCFLYNQFYSPFD